MIAQSAPSAPEPEQAFFAAGDIEPPERRETEIVNRPHLEEAEKEPEEEYVYASDVRPRRSRAPLFIGAFVAAAVGIGFVVVEGGLLGESAPLVATAPVEPVTPPVETAPVAPVETAPVAPVETPPVEAATPPVETPPVETPPVETPPVETPPVEVAAVEAVEPEPEPEMATGPPEIAVRFESKPPGAAVFVDGSELGNTPLDTTVPVKRGPRKVVFRYDGHVPVTKKVALKEGTRVAVALAPLKRKPVRAVKRVEAPSAVEDASLKEGALVNPFKKKKKP